MQGTGWLGGQESSVQGTGVGETRVFRMMVSERSVGHHKLTMKVYWKPVQFFDQVCVILALSFLQN